MARTNNAYSVEHSRSLLARARKVEALIDARPTLFSSGIERIGGYPLFVERACGPYIWDVDGNRYIDFMLGYGSVVLGHAHPAVLRAVYEESQFRGSNPTLLSMRHVELAERIVEMSPGVESVTFLKTGSDATGAAIRLARAITGRPYIFHWGLHGWHDWCAGDSAGVLRAVKEFTVPIRYNDLDYAKSLFSTHGRDVACVILMPYEVESPVPGFLEGLHDLCRKYGALLIFDEIRSGFRISLGGAQEYFGVEADLVTYGKALGNGYAISVLAGRRKYMQNILSAGLTITYFRIPDAMAAALATIDELARCSGPQYLRSLGRVLMDGLDSAALEEGVPAHSIGLPWTPFLKFDYESNALCHRALQMFCNGMISRGILVSPLHHWFLCTSMSAQDIKITIEVAREVFAEIRHSL